MINDDLISRSALMKYINDNHPYAGLPMAAHICTMELLTYAPAVDAVKVVHGRWENITDYGGGNCFGYCSNCRMPIKSNNRTALLMDNRYCRYCGTKMDGGK